MHIPPPIFLPRLQSKKWHNRKRRDPVGYLRVQHLQKGRADINLPSVLRNLTLAHRRPSELYVTDLGPLAEALRLLKDISRSNRPTAQTQSDFDQQLDKTWVEALKYIDRFLESEHEAHIKAVRDGGASGI